MAHFPIHQRKPALVRDLMQAGRVWVGDRSPDELSEDAEVGEANSTERLLAQAPGVVVSDFGGLPVGPEVPPVAGESPSPPPVAAGNGLWLAAGGLALTTGAGLARQRDEEALDTMAPTLHISDGIAAGFVTGAVVFTFNFSEAVSDFTIDDVLVSGGAKGVLSGSGATYTLTVTPAANTRGNLLVSVAAGAARDAAGNASVAALAEHAFDSAAPTLTISDDFGGLAVGDVVYTFRFSEPVSGFGADDIVVVGGDKGALSGDGTTYTMTVTPTAASRGELSLSVAAGAAVDVAGNGNVGAVAATQTFNTTREISTGIAFADRLGYGYRVDEFFLSDGRVLVVGPEAMARFLPDGTPDPGFSGDGWASVEFEGRDRFGGRHHLLPDGKLLIVGKSGLARYNTDGTPDAGFGGDGSVELAAREGIGYPFGSLVLPDGKVLVVSEGVSTYQGSSKVVFSRHNVDGSPDTSFSDDGVVVADFGKPVYMQYTLLDDGKLLVGASANVVDASPQFMLTRFNADGSPDLGFFGDGVVTADAPTGVWRSGSFRFLADGRIVLLTANGMTCLNSDGSLDGDFGVNGTVAFASGRYLALRDYGLRELSGGKLLVVGNGYQIGESGTYQGVFSLSRYDANGRLDASFGEGGMTTTVIDYYLSETTAFAPQSDGKLLALASVTWGLYGEWGDFRGEARAMVTRYDTDGHLDTGFSGDGKLVFDFFNGSSTPVEAYLQPDGKTLIFGNYTDLLTDLRSFAVARLNADGSLDKTFSGDGIATMPTPYRVAYSSYRIDADGGLLLVGFDSYGTGALVRLDTNGEPDINFGAPARAVLDKTSLSPNLAAVPHVAGFVDGIDRIALSRLSYEQLTIVDGSGAETGNAVIGANGQYLAVVMGMSPIYLSAADFMIV